MKRVPGRLLVLLAREVGRLHRDVRLTYFCGLVRELALVEAHLRLLEVADHRPEDLVTLLEDEFLCCSVLANLI